MDAMAILVWHVATAPFWATDGLDRVTGLKFSNEWLWCQSLVHTPGCYICSAHAPQNWIESDILMTCPLNKPPGNGPSSQLIAWLNHLQNLLKHLPDTLPLNLMPSHYGFGLDNKAVAEEGVWYAFNHNMEVNFETHKMWHDKSGSPVLREQGECWIQLVQTMKDTIKMLTKDEEHNFLCKIWLEQLIRTAEAHGAKIPSK